MIKSDPIDLGEGEEASVVKEETGGRGIVIECISFKIGFMIHKSNNSPISFTWANLTL